MHLIIAQIEDLEIRQPLVGALERFHGGHIVVIEIDCLQIGYIVAYDVQRSAHDIHSEEWTKDGLQILIGVETRQIERLGLHVITLGHHHLHLGLEFFVDRNQWHAAAYTRHQPKAIRQLCMPSQLLYALCHLKVIREEDSTMTLRAPILRYENMRRHCSQQSTQQRLLLIDLAILYLQT